MSRESLRDRAHGRWRGILAELGLSEAFLTGRHGPCPWCGGHDRWRFIDKEGSGNWICNQCGTGDGVALALRVTGMDFRELGPRIDTLLRTVPVVKKPARKDVSREAMQRLWSGAMSLIGTPGELYFQKRGLIATARSLRYSPQVWYSKEERSPAILAQVADVAGRCVNLYRIFIDRDGNKAAFERPKRMMRSAITGPIAVRLFASGPVLGVAEGIENAIAARMLFDMPVWAAMGTVFLERFVEPEGVEELVVFADRDENFAGQKAAYTLANKAVVARKRKVTVRVPEAGDWNDELLAQC